MRKLIYLFILGIGFTSCSVESMDSTENLLTADANFKIQQVDKSMNLEAVEICAGEAPVFVFNFPQDTKGNGDPKNTDIKIQIETFPGSGVWESFADLTYAGAGPEEYTYEDEILELGIYSFRVKIGAGGLDYTATLDVVKCSDCEESFNYVDNADGTYTFTYTVGEDMDNADLVFTFAQGSYVTGLSDAFFQNGNNGQTYQAEMDLSKCDVLSYTVSLTPKCSGQGATSSNVWTDFKVNDISKKANENDKFTASCN